MSKKIVVTIYSKPGCCLCDEAKANILASPCCHQIELREVNIETDAELFERYRYEIPVIFIGERKAFKYHVTAQEFCARLRRHLNGE
ncbi:MAG: glutaredoxin family protein [Acidobacteriota bacterium]